MIWGLWVEVLFDVDVITPVVCVGKCLVARGSSCGNGFSSCFPHCFSPSFVSFPFLLFITPLPHSQLIIL